MKPKRQRLILVLAALVSISLSFFIIAKVFNENLVFFFSPTELIAKNITPDKLIRIGGLVKNGSVKKEKNTTYFLVTDLKNSISVKYTGILPDLFREGQGVVAEGYYKNGALEASEVLAKHDEKYMPPEVVKSLKKSGRWQEGAE